MRCGNREGQCAACRVAVLLVLQVWCSAANAVEFSRRVFRVWNFHKLNPFQRNISTFNFSCQLIFIS